MGSGLSDIPSTRLKMAVFAPIPSASVTTATDMGPGDFRKIRSPWCSIPFRRVEPPSRPLLCTLLSRSLHSAKLDHCLSACLGSIESCRLFHGYRLLKMKPEFFVQFVRLLAKNKEPKPSQRFRNHDEASAARPRTIAIADESRSQLASSVSSCFLPAAVNR